MTTVVDVVEPSAIVETDVLRRWRAHGHAKVSLPPGAITHTFNEGASMPKRNTRTPKSRSRPCSVKDCDNPIKTAGLCHKHYLRQWRHGDVHVIKSTKGLPTAERIRLRSKDDGECRVWTGPKHDAMGYARMLVDGRLQYVHRVAWELVNGPVPDGLVLLHSCDNASCVRVEHLSLGTQRDNVQDMLEKGRADRRGDRANPAKLTWPQVREIRRLFAEGATRTQLSNQFGICHSQISNIVTNRHWKESA